MTKKKFDYRNIFGILGVLALIVSMGVYVFAQNFGNSVNVEGDYNDYKQINLPVGEGVFGTFGPTATATPEIATGLSSVNISDFIRFGDDNTKTTDGITYYTRIITFTDSTTTPVIFTNTFGEPISVHSFGVKPAAKSTTTASMAVASSTAPFVPPASDSLAFFGDGAAGTIISLTANQFGADGGAYATNTVAWTDVSDNVGTAGLNQFPLILLPDQTMFVFATTGLGNDAIINGNVFNDSKAYILFSTVD